MVDPGLRPYIEFYRQQGLSIFPIQPRSKEPYFALLPGGSWKEYQSRQPSDTEIDSWFRRPIDTIGIGIVCGPVSGNFCVVDSDSVAAYHQFWGDPAKIEEATVVVATGRGRHVWFRTIEPVCFKVHGLFDFKGRGGYVLAPPSIHPSGTEYYFVNEVREVAFFPELRKSILKRAAKLGFKTPHFTRSGSPSASSGITAGSGWRSLSDKSKTRIVNRMVPVWTKPHRNDLSMYLLGTFVKRRVSEDDAREVISSICELAGDEEQSARLNEVRRHYSKPAQEVPRLKGMSGLREVLG